MLGGLATSFGLSLLSAGASLGSSFLGAAASADAAHEQRKTMREYMRKQAQENAINRQWTEEMSNTAHQREVKDLREAGLNPILSATGGNGASSPTVSSNILGANDASAGLELQGKLKALESLAGLANQLSQLDLNSALSAKAFSDAGRSAAETEYINSKNMSERVRGEITDGSWNIVKNLYNEARGKASSAENPFTFKNLFGLAASSARSVKQSTVDTWNGLMGNVVRETPARRSKAELEALRKRVQAREAAEKRQRERVRSLPDDVAPRGIRVRPKGSSVVFGKGSDGRSYSWEEDNW